MKLRPDKCLVRFCRNCGKPMDLKQYDWDSDYRWYYFHCEDCEFDVRIGESISKDMRNWNQEDGDFLEPLTKEEMEYQNSSQADEDTKRMFDDIVKERKEEQKRRKEFKNYKSKGKDSEDLK